MAKKDKRNHQNHSPHSGAPTGTADETAETRIEPEAANAESPAPEPAAPDEEAQPSPASRKEQELEAKVAALNERYIRLLAEYDNYRKRTAREMECVADIASEKLIREFLPILDNLDRATEHRNDKTTLEEYVKGIVLIEEQLRKVLAQAGLRRMDVIGERFDPASHDAILQVESQEKEPGIVVGEAEKGYLLNGKVIRHPKVVISK